MTILKSIQEHRKELLSQGADATFEVPLRFVKSFVGEYTNGIGETKTGKIIEGIASTEEKDQQGEVVMQDKMDCSYLLEKGYLNWNHSHSPEDQIGKPLEVIKMPGGPTTPNNLPCTFFRALLFENVPRADAVWVLAQALDQAQGIGNSRSLGFSVEGGVRLRHGNILTETIVRHMATTHEPVNAQAVARCVMAKSQGFKVHESVMVDTADSNVPHFIFKSFGQLVKALSPDMTKTIGTQDVPALLTENLSGLLTTVSFDPSVIIGKLYNPCKSGRNCKGSNGNFMKGHHGALDHLVYCVGIPPRQAADALATHFKLFW